MDILKPDWNQAKPTWQDSRDMIARIQIAQIEVHLDPVRTVLDEIRRSHDNGDALLTAFSVGSSTTFDWFASRNRLLEFDLLPRLLVREEIRQSMADLQIPTACPQTAQAENCVTSAAFGFKMESSFSFDCHLAYTLYSGGAYSHPTGDGRAAKQQAIDFCDALFQQRYSEVSLFNSFEAWTPWFHGIAWDWTAVLFDLRQRVLWFLAVTDTD